MAGTHALMTGSAKKRTKFVNITSDTNNVNLASYAASAGWDSAAPLVVYVDSDVIVGSTSTSTYALRINSTYPNGLTLINKGYIVGKGGDGGVGQDYPFNTPAAAEDGGPALYVGSSTDIRNLGYIMGGGGGGAGGCGSRVGSSKSGYSCYGGSGGGGGQGVCGGFGGAGGTSTTGDGVAGGDGSFDSAGTRGAAVFSGQRAGGSGGQWGSQGCEPIGTFGTPGNGGAAICGNSYITWLETGIRCGSINS